MLPATKLTLEEPIARASCTNMQGKSWRTCKMQGISEDLSEDSVAVFSWTADLNFDGCLMSLAQDLFTCETHDCLLTIATIRSQKLSLAST